MVILDIWQLNITFLALVVGVSVNTKEVPICTHVLIFNNLFTGKEKQYEFMIPFLRAAHNSRQKQSQRPRDSL